MDKRSADHAVVSASQLAQMGTCERLMRYEHRGGMRPGRQRTAAIERGNVEHRRFHAEAVRSLQPPQASLPGKPWCFVATMLYGPDDPATEVLRRFRDALLRPTIMGRALIRLYYRLSPDLCRLMQRHPRLLPPVRLGVATAVWLAEAVLDRHNGRRP
ncbi:CFI-box-CTERM domain-containing protein [Rugamonas aquatica]|uniref:Uncharacterized protein n=1 Tax=Rugamonas aquatica TaxID=2743357 RepID=A0A6A7N6B4_9BURK|nr:CFI-box-CTERM domain-containing protein [Rugamonas aquatica]MQA40576.1 hypothetical protein [Rugamonas aquatica]